MYLYWRVQQDLSSMGEIIIFHDPSLIRCHKKWVLKNATGIAMAEDLSIESLFKLSLN